MVTNIFDSHAHYNDKKFDTNREQLLNTLPTKGITKIINVGSNIKESYESVELSKNYNYIYSSVGIHPLEVNNLPPNYLYQLENLLKEKKVVAIGEIGLDYHYGSYTSDIQKKFFKEQLSLAYELNMPVIIHSREADQDTIEILKNFKLRGVIHCFSSSCETAEILIKMGYHLGFTGVITFKNNTKHSKIIYATPIEKILIETDCPYMAPEPFRGQICNSTMLPSIIEKIATIKNIPLQEVANKTNFNTCNLFNIE